MPLALVVSDVDGTLVTPDKTLTPAAIAAARRLSEAGIGFTLCSSRPPFGLKGLVAALDLRLPLGAFNGGAIVAPDLAPIARTLIPAPTARRAAALMERAGLDIWVFADGLWAARDPEAAYVDLERRTLDADPTIVPDLGDLLGRAAKVVGVSADPALVRRAESELAEALGDAALVHRSQPYYLDVTPPGVSKGSFVAWLARRLGIARQDIATIGDAGNDRAMFEASGLSVAMGNAPPELRRAASFVTGDNRSEGFAAAIERLLASR